LRQVKGLVPGRFHLHFTPTSACWLNLVERWFAELTNRKLRRSAHRSVTELEADIRKWTNEWNADPNLLGPWLHPHDPTLRPEHGERRPKTTNPKSSSATWPTWSPSTRRRRSGGDAAPSDPRKPSADGLPQRGKRTTTLTVTPNIDKLQQ
jgi:hypothetical protein